MRWIPSIFALTFALASAGCSKRSAPAHTEAVDAAKTAPIDASAPEGKALPFIEDNYAAALADARAKGRPIFVDVWATWCHTCLSLKNFVLTDPLLAAHASAFTWLAIDSEKPQNADLTERLGLKVLPTLWVIDPATEKPIWTWKGALTAQELDAALVDARAKGAPPGSSKAREAMLAAERAAAAGNANEAVARYREALKGSLPPSERGRAADALVSLLEEAKAIDECVDVARREGGALGESTYRVDLAAIGARCALEAKDGTTQRSMLATYFVPELRALTRSSSPAVLADDRSSAFETLVDSLKAIGDKDAATKAATSWATFLENQASKAKTPKERVVFDAHRVGAYIELGDPARALPMLEQSERDFPDDYNPSARKARALFELGRYDEALASIDRALARAYGPRRLRLHVLKADIMGKKRDVAGERRALDEALADATKMQLRASYERLRKSIDERARRLPAIPAASRP